MQLTEGHVEGGANLDVEEIAHVMALLHHPHRLGLRSCSNHITSDVQGDPVMCSMHSRRMLSTLDCSRRGDGGWGNRPLPPTLSVQGGHVSTTNLLWSCLLKVQACPEAKAFHA